MTTAEQLTVYMSDCPVGTPVLVLLPNGDKVACRPGVDTNGAVVLVPDGVYAHASDVDEHDNG